MRVFRAEPQSSPHATPLPSWLSISVWPHRSHTLWPLCTYFPQYIKKTSQEHLLWDKSFVSIWFLFIKEKLLECYPYYERWQMTQGLARQDLCPQDLWDGLTSPYWLKRYPATTICLMKFLDQKVTGPLTLSGDTEHAGTRRSADLGSLGSRTNVLGGSLWAHLWRII